MRLLIFILILPFVAAGEKPNLGASVLLLSHKKSADMDDHLKMAAEAGFRVMAVTQAVDGNTNVLMRKQTGAPSAYQMLRSSNINRLKGRVTTAASEGYRLIPGSLMVKGSVMSNKTFMLVMEKEPGAGSYDCKVLISKMDDKLASVLEKLTADGYQSIAMFSQKNDVQVIFMEKKTS